MDSGTLLLLQLAGSVAMLLWGLNMLSAAISKQFGWRLKRLASAAGNRRIPIFGSGIVLGGSFQSSTAAILLGGQMVAQGTLNTAQGLALALGADVGATLAAQLLGWNLVALTPPLLLIAYLINRLGKHDSTRQISHILFGIALIILALQMVFHATEPLRQSEITRLILTAIADKPLILIIIAALLTFICHSALAVVLIVVALVSNATIEPITAFWLILGVNAGGGLPAVLAGWSEGAAMRRIVVGNALFRLLGVIFIAPFALYIEAFMANTFSPARSVVHFHTFINLAMSIPLLLLTVAAARWLEQLLKTLDSENKWKRLRYLGGHNTGDSSNKQQRTAPLQLAHAIRETLNMGDLVARMLDYCARLFKKDDSTTRTEISELDDAVDYLNREIKLFTTNLDESTMNDEDKRRSNLVLSTITHLEHIGDIIDNGIRRVLKRMQQRRVRFSEDGISEIRDIYDIVRQDLNATLGLLVSPDPRVAHEQHQLRLHLANRCQHTFESHLMRLRRGRSESIESSSMHLDLVRDLKRISDHIAAIADSILTISTPTDTPPNTSNHDKQKTSYSMPRD